MPAKTTSDDSRKRLISTAAKLFQEQGYAATGLTEILRGANTPKGSLYHHFPEGKSELGAAAMRAAGLALRTTFDQCYARTGHSSLAMLAFSEELSGWLTSSQFKKGCPMATVALEQTPANTPLADTIQGAFERVADHLRDAMVTDGIEAKRAERLALFILSSFEGALILARVKKSTYPIETAGQEAARLIKSENASLPVVQPE